MDRIKIMEYLENKYKEIDFSTAINLNQKIDFICNGIERGKNIDDYIIHQNIIGKDKITLTVFI